jgi:hypothetical protein
MPRHERFEQQYSTYDSHIMDSRPQGRMTSQGGGSVQADVIDLKMSLSRQQNTMLIAGGVLLAAWLLVRAH